ncbi:MAG: hypothetical protein R2799_13995 [Crocinitomicaceae bacterium]
MTGDTAKLKTVITEDYGKETKAAFEEAMKYDPDKSDLQNYVKGKQTCCLLWEVRLTTWERKKVMKGRNKLISESAELMKMVGVIDTNSYVNAAICAEKIERYDLLLNHTKYWPNMITRMGWLIL